MIPAHGKTQELSDEQQEFNNLYTDPQEVETEQTLNQFLTYIAAFVIRKVLADKEKFQIFQAVSSEKLSETLLDVSNPQALQNATECLKMAKKEFGAQNFDPKTKKFTKDTASRSFLGKTATISTGTLTKAEQQIVVGNSFHSLVSLHEKDTRINQAASIYTIQNKEEFETKVSAWMKENPGKDFDDALHIVGERQFKLEKAGDETAELSEDQKNAFKSHTTELSQKELKDEAHQKSIEYGESIKPQAQEVMAKIKSSEKGLNPDQFQTELAEIGKPIPEPIPTPVSVPIPPSPPPNINIPSAPPPVYIAPQPTLGGLQPSLSSSPAINTIPTQISPRGLSSRFGKFSEFLGKLNPENLLKGGLGRLAASLGIKKGLLAAGSALLGIGTGGVSLAAQAGLALVNHFLHLDKVVGYSAKAIGIFLLVIIGAPILIFVLGDFQQIGTLFPPTPPNLGASNPSNLSWSIFEKDYLQIAIKKEEKNLSWNEFQNKYLTQSNFLLTDTNNLQPTTNN